MTRMVGNILSASYISGLVIDNPFNLVSHVYKPWQSPFSLGKLDDTCRIQTWVCLTPMADFTLYC